MPRGVRLRRLQVRGDEYKTKKSAVQPSCERRCGERGYLKLFLIKVINHQRAQRHGIRQSQPARHKLSLAQYEAQTLVI